MPVTSCALLPSGTLTFAFTDIVGSTDRWERFGAAMGDAVRRHDALLRRTISEAGGHVFKTLGDGCCAAFSRPQDAVAAMLAVQRALAAADFSAVDGLRVRAAIHTGTADERDGDYFGPAVNRVARLLAIAHGGQILLASSTAELVHGVLPAQTSLCALGVHRLKDLARAEEVHQLLAPGLTLDFPALRSLDALPNNLPRMLTSFVGRDVEVAQIVALLEEHRLVTLFGSGGIGKTRASLQVGADLAERFADGVWFVELAPLTSGDYIASTVAQALEATLASDGDPLENLVRTLAASRALLVFDNCEHVLDGAARVVGALLRGCPHLKILASSRQALGISGETTYRLPSLGIPADGGTAELTASDVRRYSALALFADRARAVDQRFTITEDNVATSAEICRRLDGIPLAIELAASRVRLLSPRQLRERLDERFRVLPGGSRDVLPRQQTLRALIDWSYDLLDERERTLFRRLGIFANGFTLEGAVAIGGGADFDELDVFDVLASLVDKSLVLAEPAGDASRYRLLESTRVYAREKLMGAGERDSFARHHVSYLRDRFVAVADRYAQTAQSGELNRLFWCELEDVRVGLDWSLNGGDARLGAEVLAAIGQFWRAVGSDREGITRIDAFLNVLPNDEHCLRARLSSAVALLAANARVPARDPEAAAKAVAHARLCGQSETLGEALVRNANLAVHQRRFDDAESALGEAETISVPSPLLRIQLLETRAYLSQIRGDLAAAALAYEQLCLAEPGIGHTFNLAEVEHARGDTPHSIALLSEAIALLRARGEHGYLGNALTNLAGYLAASGDHSGACAAAREAIRELAPREPDAAIVLVSIEHLALALSLAGDFDRGATLAGFADNALRQRGFEREFTERATRARLDALLQDRLPPSDYARLLREGEALPVAAAVSLALAEPSTDLNLSNI